LASNVQIGKIVRISGPVVEISGLNHAQLYEIVRVGEEKLIGEIIRINKSGNKHISTVQVYEETAGLKPREEAIATGKPLSAELGPGLITRIYDGTQRPLPVLQVKEGNFITRGITSAPLDLDRKWDFKPLVKKGDTVKGGSHIGEVKESRMVNHKVMVPPEIGIAKVSSIVGPEKYSISETIAQLDVEGRYTSALPITMKQTWTVRKPRPFKRKLEANIPLITGQRIYDTFFPIAKGGVAAIPGGFGTGKCVTGDTPVLLESGDSIPIKQIYDCHMENNGIIEEDSENETLIRLIKPLSVISFDGTKYSSQKATHVYRGNTNAIVKIKTRSGRVVEITPIHKLFKFNGESIEETAAKDLKIGDNLIVPRKLNIEGEETKFNCYDVDLSLRVIDQQALQKMKSLIKHLKQTMTLKQIAVKLNVSYDVFIGYWLLKNKPTLTFLKNLAKLAKAPLIPVKLIKSDRQSYPFQIPDSFTKELAEWLGLFVADGHIKGRKGGIYLYNNNDQILQRFSILTEFIFDLDVEIGQEDSERTPYACIRNESLKKFLYYLGIPKERKTYNVRIPQAIRKGSDDLLVHFLAGYFAGDGSFYRYTVEFSTASKNLFSDLGYLLTRLGLNYRAKIKGNSFIYYIDGKEAELLAGIFKLTGVHQYNKLIPLYSYAAKNIQHFIGRDVVPIGNQVLVRLHHEVKENAGYDVLRQRKDIRLSNYTKKGQIPTLSTLKRISNTLEEHQINIPTNKTLDTVIRLSQEVYFDKIISIELIEETTPVYDLTVDITHNFVGGILPFTLHNTVSQHQLAKWSDATVVVYVGCGERGNEMAEVLKEFPDLEDPRSGEKLMQRTVLIANTSNMPVAAREASIYLGITIAEYYRDMGYDVALMADSTSRWAEALREISGRLEEMPGEEGYPAYLASRIAEFYERAGRIETLSGHKASISAIGAVSPGGGDFSEPVTQNTLKTVRVFWALSYPLARSRHFPAISWLESYSLYINSLANWYGENVAADFSKRREEAMALLQKEKELQEIVQLIGPDALPESEKIILQAAKMIREDFLQQNAYSDDSYCALDKQYKMLHIIMQFYSKMQENHNAGVPLEKMISLSVLGDIASLKWSFDAEFKDLYEKNLDFVQNKMEPSDFGIA
jgi:V/A-type H+-transporting ATPase subunit A